LCLLAQKNPSSTTSFNLISLYAEPPNGVNGVNGNMQQASTDSGLLLVWFLFSSSGTASLCSHTCHKIFPGSSSVRQWFGKQYCCSPEERKKAATLNGRWFMTHHSSQHKEMVSENLLLPFSIFTP